MVNINGVEIDSFFVFGILILSSWKALELIIVLTRWIFEKNKVITKKEGD